MVDSIPIQAALGGTVVAVTQAPLPSALHYPIIEFSQYALTVSDVVAMVTFVGFLISVGLSIRKNLKK